MYQQALKSEPGNVSAQVNLGNAYFALDRLDDAAGEFTEASGPRLATPIFTAILGRCCCGRARWPRRRKKWRRQCD